jgi:hypothetical protein
VISGSCRRYQASNPTKKIPTSQLAHCSSHLVIQRSPHLAPRALTLQLALSLCTSRSDLALHTLTSHLSSSSLHLPALTSRSHLAPRTSYLARRTSHLVPRISYLAPCTSRLVLAARSSHLPTRSSQTSPRSSHLSPPSSYLPALTSRAHKSPEIATWKS